MSYNLLSGKELSAQILNKITTQVEHLENKRKPCLAVILVGDDPASEVYVKNKKNACVRVGIKSLEYKLQNIINQIELLDLIHKLNQDNDVDGILVQLPLPKHIDSTLIIDNIAPNKDVDGFHRYNMGSLTLKDPHICPCTPHGVMYMLDSIATKYHGLHAVILGASNIVGRPMALELINRGTTVTICNSKTRNLPNITKTADILITAIGKPKLVKADWINPGAIIIDVGINRLEDGTLCGDVDFEQVAPLTSYITPVPGGVGPMTIAMLISNTMLCYEINVSA
jgi:methylenetetrahydrofolate dehydrogenase (NADP+) / methenyltetrahydrofolate cyclohydrolase